MPPGNKADKTLGLIDLCRRQRRLEELLERCAQQRPQLPWRSFRRPSEKASSPFKGLQYYDVADADLFFGREALTAELVAHLQQNRFLAVVGASGSGKSSLVRAGLVPAFLSTPATDDWQVHVLTPTAHPLEALAATLTRQVESITATATLIDDLKQDARSLHLFARKQSATGQKLLLVIDQFEELFTLCRSEALRQAFIDNLLTAVAREESGPLTAVIALRADFYHHCAQYNELRQLLQEQQHFIGEMTQAELRRAIEEPARRHNLTFETGLVDLLLRDVGAVEGQSPEPGALPLLSHALLETWRRRQGNQLTFAGYADAGGVQGAIAKTAETVYQQLTAGQQSIARSTFLRLTELGEGTQDTRRRAPLDELLPADDAAEETQTVLHLLAEARLIITDESSAEVAHEALIREWPSLRRWLDENREGLRLHRHLTESAQEWQQLNRDPGELYRGARLEQAQEWAAQHDDEMNDLEREFLAASMHEANKRKRLVRFGIFSLVCVLIVVTIFGLVFLNQAREKQELADDFALQVKIADSARESADRNAATAVAAQATSDQNALNAENNAATVIAVEATQLIRSIAGTATAEAAQQIDADGDGLTLAQEINYGTDPTLQDSDFDGLPDGNEIQAGSDPLDFDTDFDGLWDGEDNDPIRPFISTKDPITGEAYTDIQFEELRLLNNFFLTENERAPFYGLAISADLNYIAAGSYASDESGMLPHLNIWFRSGDMITPFDTGTEDTVWATGFAFNRLHAVVGTAVFSYDLNRQSGWQQSMVSGFGNMLCSAAFHPNNSTLLVGGRAKWGYFQITENGLVEIESISQNENTNVCNIDSYFSYDGNFFGRVRSDGSVFVGETIERSFARPFNGSAIGAIDMALSPDNNILALGFENGRVELYDYSERRGGPPIIYGLDAHPSLAHAVFSPDGTILATSSPEDSIVRLWRAENGSPLLELDAEADGVTSLIFSQDGHYLLFGTTAGEVHVYGMPEVQP